MDHLGLASWQKLAIYIGPPLLIGLIVIWRAVYKATTHPDQKLLKKEARERQRHHQVVPLK